MFNSFFQWSRLHRNNIFNLGEMNFSVSSPRPTEKTCVFLCVYFFFLCGLTHRKISFNLGEHIFSMRETHRKIVSDREPTEKFDFSIILFLCVIFWWYTVRKIFFHGYSNFSVGFCTHRNIRVSSSVCVVESSMHLD